MPLSEVVRSLIDDTRRRDPEGKGVNFILNASPVVAEVDAAGLPVDLNGVAIRLGTKLNDLSCEEVLDIIVSIADRPIQYSVEPYAVVFTAKTKPRQPLHTRFFRIDAETLVRGLDAMLPPSSTKRPAPKPKPGNASQAGRTAYTNSLTKVTGPGESVIPTVVKWFKTLRVDLSAPGKTVRAVPAPMTIVCPSQILAEVATERRRNLGSGAGLVVLPPPMEAL